MDADELEKLVERSLAAVPATGVAVSAVMGSVAATRCRGTVAGVAVTGRSLLYAASVTKQLVGLLAACAVQEHRLTYRDRIADHLPGLPLWSEGVEVRHLLHHTSGLPDVTAALSSSDVRNADVLAGLRAISPQPTPRPGAQFSYNNTGYVLLALVIEAAFAEPIEQLAARRLFGPLEMVDSHLGAPPRPLPGFADPPGTVGDGGLWTTVDDLRRWLTGLNQLRPSPAAVQQLERPGELDDGVALDYGWGVRVTPVPAGRMITHGGSWPGWLAKTVRIPERRIAVAVLSHDSHEGDISRLGTTLADRIAAASGV